jgi:uncharacterized protein (DUF983 family)
MLGTLWNILKCRCPRCRQSKLFAYPLSLNIKKDLEMKKSCPVCGLDFEQEPGYYYGAMYVSYAFAITELIITLAVVYVVTNQLSIPVVLVAMGITLVLLSPINFRWGRAGWLSVFHGYDRSFHKR